VKSPTYVFELIRGHMKLELVVERITLNILLVVCYS
jgi:hypothetical protein